jgi:hypothetical protein
MCWLRIASRDCSESRIVVEGVKHCSAATCASTSHATTTAIARSWALRTPWWRAPTTRIYIVVSNCSNLRYKCRLYVLTLATAVTKQIVIVEVVSTSTPSSPSAPPSTKAAEVIIVVFVVVEISHAASSSVSSLSYIAATTTHHHARVAAAHHLTHTSHASWCIHHGIHARHATWRTVRMHASHAHCPLEHTSRRWRARHHATIRSRTIQSGLL